MTRKHEDTRKIVDIEAYKAAQLASSNAKTSHASNAAFVENLYRENWAKLCGRLRRVFGDGPPEPEDLAQQAFAKLIEKNSSEELKLPGAYLFRLGMNAGLDVKRRNMRARKYLEQEIILKPEENLQNLTPSDVLEENEKYEKLKQAISRLPERQREVLVRSRFKGETYLEISSDLKCSQASVSRDLGRALKALQLYMRSVGNDRNSD